MVELVGVGTCTPTKANVCLGSETKLMDLYNLNLAEYRASSDAVYPAEFGGCVPLAGQPVYQAAVPAVETPDPSVSQVAAPDISASSGYSNISESAYIMQERYVPC